MFLKTAIVFCFCATSTVFAFKKSFSTQLIQASFRSVDRSSLSNRHFKEFDIGKVPLDFISYFDYTVNVTIGTPREFKF